MRKLVLLGLVFALASGCGRGWLPMFRGAPCRGNACGLTAPALPAAYDAGCNNCGQSAGFGDYQGSGDSFGLSSDNYYDGGVIVGGGYPSPGATVPPSMQTLPQPSTGN